MDFELFDKEMREEIEKDMKKCSVLAESITCNLSSLNANRHIKGYPILEFDNYGNLICF